MPDTNPITKKKIEVLNKYPVSEANTGKRKYTFHEIMENFQATFDCREIIIKARKKTKSLP